MNAKGKSIDKTYLSLDTAEERNLIHRDYIAHCFRWSHVAKRLLNRQRYKTAVVLDIGCGRELPMAKMLYSNRLIVNQYYGVDVGPINDTAINVFSSGKFPLLVWDETDICDLEPDNFTTEDGIALPTHVTCFEMLEHIEPAHCLRVLAKMKELATDEAEFIISTPCWNVVDCAANHVNEISYDALGAIFEMSGFVVQEVYGTFASMTDYMSHLSDEARNILDRLRDFYDSNIISTFIAPLIPQYSRNALWVLKKRTMNYQIRKFKNLEQVPVPWSSSEKWNDFLPNFKVL